MESNHPVFGKVVVVIVTHNRLATLRKTLDYMLAQPITEIVLIDNASTDGTDSSLSQVYDRLVYHRLDENIGSAGGFAKGMQLAHDRGADWIWIFNDDSRPLGHALDKLAEVYQKSTVDQKVGFIKVTRPAKAEMYSMMRWEGVRKGTLCEEQERLIEVGLITFDGCMISRSVIDEIGYPFAPFFMGIYEFDYCIRASQKGFKIYILPLRLLEDEKLGSSGPNGSPPWRMYYNTRNHLYMGIKNRDTQTIMAWLVRESKYVGSIILRRDRKIERLLFKGRAVRDALLGRMGRRYNPSDYN